MLASHLLSLALCTGHGVGIAIRQTQNTITADDIIKVAPSTASCSNPKAAGECATAADAQPWIALSFSNFQLDSFGAQAALLATMLYESGNFQYSKNHYPGTPGQGTRNMQSPAFNLKYATWLANQCKNCQISAQAVQQAQAQGPDALLALVNIPQWSFGSAAWFLATQCDADVQQNLASGSQAAWAAYLGCVGASVTDDRTQIFNAIMALKHW